MESRSSGEDVHYTAFIRLPFPRQDFVDPPLIDWNAAKDRALWKILSRNPGSSDLDWKDLASRFDVSLPFILQQAAWLYERQLSRVRAQMRKVTTESPAKAPSQNLSMGGVAMQRGGSAGSGRSIGSVRMQRGESSESGPQVTLNVGRTSPGLGSAPPTPRGIPIPARYNQDQNRPPMVSRTPSTNTVTQSRAVPPSSPSTQVQLGTTAAHQSPKTSSYPSFQTAKVSYEQSESETTSSEDDSDDDSSSDTKSSKILSRSQMFRRTPRSFAASKGKQKKTPADVEDDSINEEEEDDDESPAFLPFAKTSGSGQQDLGQTVKGPQKANNPSEKSKDSKNVSTRENTESSASSASSTAAPLVDRTKRAPRSQVAVSPRHRAELAKANSMKRGNGKEGSDGTPSMGSSFSDLDDTSVTQSALEEALMSNMQHGGMASRMSNLSQALKSRYL